jgi:hypothetical protein
VTGRRASFTKHVCANPGCGKKFRPVRADAEYCSNACKQAHYRARTKAKAEAEAHFRIKRNTLDFEANQRAAIDLYGKVRGIEVIATNTGVLVAETVPGARALAALMLPDWQQAPIQPQDVPALLRSAPVPRYPDSATRRERQGSDFRYRTAERDFRAAMKKPAHSISLFTYEPPLSPPPPSDAYRAAMRMPHRRPPHGTRWSTTFTRWLDVEDDRPKPEPQAESDPSEWLERGDVFVTDNSWIDE